MGEISGERLGLILPRRVASSTEHLLKYELVFFFLFFLSVSLEQRQQQLSSSKLLPVMIDEFDPGSTERYWTQHNTDVAMRPN